jgi:transcriptional regulator with XRE-family HTH domain
MYESYAILRDRKGMKDADVAKATGISRSTFSEWKSGRSEPKVDKLYRIAGVLGCRVDDFFYDYRPIVMKEMERQKEAEKRRKEEEDAHTIDMSKDEFDLLMQFRKTDDRTRRMILYMLGVNKELTDGESKKAE